MRPGHDAFQEVVARVRPQRAEEFPSDHGNLVATLQARAQDLAPGDLLVVSDLVWQTAPSLELIRAFAPPPGRDKVRPVEGYEMQAEHAGFEVVERVVVEPARWHGAYAEDEAKRAALAADARGAARLCVWVLRRAST